MGDWEELRRDARQIEGKLEVKSGRMSRLRKQFVPLLGFCLEFNV